MNVHSTFSHYGGDADQYLEPENFYEGESKYILRDLTVRAAERKAAIVKKVLENKYVLLSSKSCEFEFKYSGLSFHKSNDEELKFWFPIAQREDFYKAERESFGGRVNNSSYIKEEGWLWHDWMESPEIFYKSKHERK